MLRQLDLWENGTQVREPLLCWLPMFCCAHRIIPKCRSASSIATRRFDGHGLARSDGLIRFGAILVVNP